jgi:hypothetical protein
MIEVLIIWMFGALASMEILSYTKVSGWKCAVLTVLWPLLALFVIGYVGYLLVKLEIEHIREKKEAKDGKED